MKHKYGCNPISVILACFIFLIHCGTAFSGSITCSFSVPAKKQDGISLPLPGTNASAGASNSGSSDSSGGLSGGDGGSDYSIYYGNLLTNYYTGVVNLNQQTIEIDDLPDGTYDVVIYFKSASGQKYEVTIENVTVSQDGTTDLGEITLLEPGAITGSVSYQGLDENLDDVPLAYVHVLEFIPSEPDENKTLPDWLNEWALTMTNAEGNFTLNNVPPGTYTIAVTPLNSSSPAYGTEIIADVVVEAGETVNATPLTPVELKPAEGTLSGIAYLSDQGPEGDNSGIFVKASSTSGGKLSYLQMTNESGEYDFGNIPNGEYRLEFYHAGYKQVYKEASVSGSPCTIEAATLFLGTRKICGTVSLQGAGLGLWGDINRSNTISSEDAECGLKLLTGLSEQNQEYGRLDTDGPVGLPDVIYSMQTDQGLRPLISRLDGTLVAVSGTSLIAVTDVDGSFTIEQVPSNSEGAYDYNIVVMADGYQVEKVAVTASSTCSHDSLVVDLEAYEASSLPSGVSCGSITGQVNLQNSPDASEIRVALDDRALVPVDDQGWFTFTDVDPGIHEIQYTCSGYKPVRTTQILVTSGSMTTVSNVILTSKYGVVKGNIVLEGNDSLSNVDIKIGPSAAQVSADAPDSDGNFQLKVPENFNFFTDEKCVVDQNNPDTCTSYEDYTLTISAGTDYQEYVLTGLNVPAGQAIDLGTITLRKPCGTPTILSVNAASSASLTASWTGVECDDLAGYNVYCSDDSNNVYSPANLVNGSLITQTVEGKWQWEISGLEIGVQYYVMVTSVDQDGLESPPQVGPADGTILPQKIGEVYCSGCSFQSLDALRLDKNDWYVFFTNSDVLQAHDLEKDDVTQKIIVGGPTTCPPIDLAVNPVGNQAYTLQSGDCSAYRLSIIDFTQTAITVTQELPLGALPYRCALSPDGEYLFISFEDKIKTIDVDAPATQTETSLTGTLKCLGVMGDYLYVGKYYSGSISVIDISDPSPLNYSWVNPNDYASLGLPPVNLYSGTMPGDMITNPEGTKMYVANYGSNSVTVINTETGSVYNVETSEDAGFSSPYRMAVWQDVLFVTNYNDSSVTLVNMKTDKAAGKVVLNAAGPKGIAVTQDGTKIFVACQTGPAIKILGYEY
ncbi:Fibronectin type III domain protein [Desulfatibacillum aliphaticivorans]|uniref:Fibronectin type III domain protein n=1 Tax=Desulfatibacillum aliphaticivorans TaxID=218208 RepID=B8FF07_DESAL|nr:fibronectin type III domain-containing protein [Desulfatibacillum aliphaticivorans]ACL03824.1 Fibronectin type III domain protein [Desulfatibacillum aliphaticivorans]